MYSSSLVDQRCSLALRHGQQCSVAGFNGQGTFAKLGRLLSACMRACVQSTLMRAISRGQLDGFPPRDVLRTVYVEHDIDASEAETPVVEFVYSDAALQGARNARPAPASFPCWERAFCKVPSLSMLMHAGAGSLCVPRRGQPGLRGA